MAIVLERMAETVSRIQPKGPDSNYKEERKLLLIAIINHIKSY